MPAKVQDALKVNGSPISTSARDNITPLDFSPRLDELRAIEDGWLDGSGEAPSRHGIDWLSSSLERYYSPDLPLPYIYPTPEGGVSLEWSLGPHRASLEIDVDTRQAEWHCLDLSTDGSCEQDLQLDIPQGWEWLATELRRLGDPMCNFYALDYRTY